MSEATRNAADLAAERLELAANVQQLRNELVAADEATRHEKSEEFGQRVAQLEALDRECELATKLENADAIVKRLSNQPNRPSPVSVQNFGHFAKVNPATGQVVGGYGMEDRSDDEARGSYEYRKAFESFIKARFKIDNVKSREHRDMLERYGKGVGFEHNEFFVPFTKDMTIGTTTNGSNAIAPDFRFDVIAPRTVAPVMSRLCNVLTTSVTSITIPRNSDTNSDTRYGTSFRPTKGETPNTTTSACSTGPFTQLTIPINTGTMYTDVSADFLADAPMMSRYIQNEASKAFAAVVDDEVINGIVANEQAEGVLVNSDVTIVKTGTNNVLVPTKIVDAFYAFRSSYSANIAWVLARGTHGKLVNLLDSTNRSLFLPTYEGGLVQGANAQILGAPAYYNEFVPASGTSLPKSMIIGDWNEYYLAMRQGYTLMVDDVSLQYANRIRLTMKYRFGGATRDPKAFRIVHESA